MMSLSVWKLAALISISHITEADLFLVCYNGSLSNSKNVTFEDAYQLITSGYIVENKPTKFVLHGYGGNITTQGTNLIAEKYLLCVNCNICCVDWSKKASYGVPFLDYPAVVRNAFLVAEKLAKALIVLKDLGLNMTILHLICHSLAAHLCGRTGKLLFDLTGIKMGRITALDPAGPLFDGDYGFERLSPNHAVFVDVAHTDINRNGIKVPVGSADYFPCPIEYRETGVQPGCPFIYLPNTPGGYCSHARSWVLFIETICKPCTLQAALAESVDSWTDHVLGLINCFGENTNQSARGNFYMRTNAQSPFGLGAAGARP